jgi:hypothetical protein
MNKIKLLTSIFSIFLLGSCMADESKNTGSTNFWEKSKHGVTVLLKQLNSDQGCEFSHHNILEKVINIKK